MKTHILGLLMALSAYMLFTLPSANSANKTRDT